MDAPLRDQATKIGNDGLSHVGSDKPGGGENRLLGNFVVEAPGSEMKKLDPAGEPKRYYRMAVARIAISFDPKLARSVRRASRKESISSWLADAARRKLRAEGLQRAVEDWEAENGTLSEVELKAVTGKERRRRP